MQSRPDELAGAFTLRAALARGMSARSVSRRVARGELVRLRSGVFFQAGAGPITRAAAVVLATGGVASHLTAARAHDLWVVDSGEWATVAPQIHRRSTEGLRIHRGALGARDVVHLKGVPVTSVRRTLVDLCEHTGRLQAVCAMESAWRSGKLTGRELMRLREDARRRVASRARDADPRSESPLETACRLLLLDAGVAVTPQWEVLDEWGAVRYRFDLLVDGTRVAIECDGRAAHDQPAAVYRDRWRANDLASRWIVLRFTWYDVFHRPDYVVATVRQTVEQAAS